MTLRSIVLSLFAVFALVACPPSAAQLQTARTARYQASASEVFQAGVAALKANNYKLKSADAVTARALAEERWYEVDGTTMSRDSEGRPQMTNAGGILFAVEVGVVADGDAFRVEVIPHVWRKRDGELLARADQAGRRRDAGLGRREARQPAPVGLRGVEGQGRGAGRADPGGVTCAGR